MLLYWTIRAIKEQNRKEQENKRKNTLVLQLFDSRFNSIRFDFNLVLILIN